MRLRSTQALVLAATTALSALSASATQIAYEGFGGTTGGPLVGAGSTYSNSDSSGWAATSGWSNISTYATFTMVNGLTAPASATAYTPAPGASNLAIQAMGGTQTETARNLFSTPTTGTLWLSVLAQGSSSNNSNEFEYACSLYTGSNGAGTDALNIGYNSTWLAGSNWGMKSPNATQTILNSTFATTANNSTTALLVAEVISGALSSTAYLWVNPTSSTDFSNPAGTAYQEATWSGAGNGPDGGLESASFQSGNLASGQTATFDELTFGTTVNDVLAPVPEPASVGIMGLAALWSLRRRRR